MAVRVGGSWSAWREVHGGVPQGSILGVFLFNATMDDLEDLPGGRHGYNLVRGDGETDGGDSPGERNTPISNGSGPEDQMDGGDSPARPLGPLVPMSHPSRTSSPVTDGGYPGEGVDLIFLPVTRNVVHALYREEPVPPEVGPRTSAKWCQRPEKIVKYVDDNLQVLQLNTEGLLSEFDEDGKPYRDKHAIIMQNTFRRVISVAESRGMKVNAGKTATLCVSDAMSF